VAVRDLDIKRGGWDPINAATIVFFHICGLKIEVWQRSGSYGYRLYDCLYCLL